MRFIKLQQAIDLVKGHPELWEQGVDEEASEAKIDQAESIFNKEFPADYKKFLECFGTLSFRFVEIKGIFRNDLENSYELNVVNYSRELHEEETMPDYLISIYSSGDGEEYCLNYKQLNKDGTPKITAYYPGSEAHAPHEVLYDNFSDCLLDLIQQVISLEEEDDWEFED